MALIVLTDAAEPLNQAPLQTKHNGYTGGSDEKLFYLRNEDASKYYVSIRVKPVITGTFGDEGIFDNSGWSVKLKVGSEQPSEGDWDQVGINEQISLPDIGTSAAADVNTNHPIWMRVYCPGNTRSDIFTNISLELKYSSKEVTG